MALIECEECGAEISDKAWMCPKCGYPIQSRKLPLIARLNWWGFELKSETRILGLPLIHIALGWDIQTGRLHIAKGIIAIGQFGIGLITIAQFGIGFLLGIGQFVCGTIVIGQFALGLYFGLGQFATGINSFGQFTFGWKRAI